VNNIVGNLFLFVLLQSAWFTMLSTINRKRKGNVVGHGVIISYVCRFACVSRNK